MSPKLRCNVLTKINITSLKDLKNKVKISDIRSLVGLTLTIIIISLLDRNKIVRNYLDAEHFCTHKLETLFL